MEEKPPPATASLLELGRSKKKKTLNESSEKFPVYPLSDQGNSPHGDSLVCQSC